MGAKNHKKRGHGNLVIQATAGVRAFGGRQKANSWILLMTALIHNFMFLYLGAQHSDWGVTVGLLVVEAHQIEFDCFHGTTRIE